MPFADNYLSKNLFLLPRIIKPLPLAGLSSFIVIIPAYLEEGLLKTLISLKNAKKPAGQVIILTIINYSESDTQNNKKINHRLFLETEKWCREHSEAGKLFYVYEAKDLPQKHAGAGLARKIGMDWAVTVFDSENNPDGIILSMDADTLVEENYFTAVEEAFHGDTAAGGCTISFLHAVEGDEFPDEVYRAVINYELHLRYFKNMLALTGFPYAYYTLGSCFGVKAEVYVRSGGMNRKKGGEDFYFLHKIFPHDKFIEIKTTTVYPSPRPSLRVPFGTGPAIYKILQSGDGKMITYNPKGFDDLRKFFGHVNNFFYSEEYIPFEFSPALKDFLTDNDFSGKIREIRDNTASPDSFRKRFFLWFDGLMVVKYLNSVTYPKVDVNEAVYELLRRMNMGARGNDMLKMLRNRDLTG